jgi:DNA-binding CsgD family transcriptional regulator
VFWHVFASSAPLFGFIGPRPLLNVPPNQAAQGVARSDPVCSYTGRLAAHGEAAVALVSRGRQGIPADIDLIARELDVLALMVEGASNKTIARQHGISVHTVKFHVGSLSTSSTPRPH